MEVMKTSLTERAMATGFMAALKGKKAEMTVLWHRSPLPFFTNIKGADQLSPNVVCSVTDSPFHNDMKNGFREIVESLAFIGGFKCTIAANHASNFSFFFGSLKI